MNKLKLKKLFKADIIRVIMISFFAALACVSIIKAATNIGSNISTDGTITGSGTNNFYGATSIGGALTATSTLNVTATSTLAGDLTVNGISNFDDIFSIDTTNNLVSVFERVPDGRFYKDASNWTLGTGWSLAGSVNNYWLAKTAGNTNAVSSNIKIVSGRTYVVRYYLVSKTAGDGITVSLGGASGTKRTAVGVWAQEITAVNSTGGIVFTPTSDFAGTIDQVQVYEKNSMGIGITGESTGYGWTGMGLLELYGITGTESQSAYGNTLYSESSISATVASSPALDTVTNGYFQTRFEPPSGSINVPTITNLSTSIAFNSSGTAHTITNLRGQTISLGEGAQSTATYTGTDWYGLYIKDSNVGARNTGTFNVASFYDLYLDGMDDFSNGTIGTSTGIWLEPQTIGTTNYGIVLDGDGLGNDLVLGANQNSHIYWSAGQTIIRTDINSAPDNITNSAMTNVNYINTTSANLNLFLGSYSQNVITEFTADATYASFIGNKTENKISSNSTNSIFDAITGLNVALTQDGTNGTQTITTYKDIDLSSTKTGAGNMAGTDWYHIYIGDFAATSSSAVTNVYGLYLADIANTGTNKYGIVLADGNDGIYFGGTSGAKITGSTSRITINNVMNLPPQTTMPTSCSQGDTVMDGDGTVGLCLCTVSGTPGTWAAIAAGGNSADCN